MSVSAGVDFGLTALRLEEGILSSLAIDLGPMFSAFDMTDDLPPQPEEEPNDSVAQAQQLQLPTRVDGVVSEEVGTDLFQFAAEAGAILTVYVITAEESDLDAFLTVELPNGALLAQNDQSGLIFKNDSFIRMVLPESGNCLIRVEDFFFGGGPTFDYSLVVKVEEQ